MVYLTGDTHGDLDRFDKTSRAGPGKRDIVVVLGDFGFVWDGSKEEQKKLDWLRKRPYTCCFWMAATRTMTCWHSTRPRSWFGGGAGAWAATCTMSAGAACWSWKARTYLCFGGAESQDNEEREPGVELVAAGDALGRGIRPRETTLEENGWQVDYVLTHDAPSSSLDFTRAGGGRVEPAAPLPRQGPAEDRLREMVLRAAITRHCSPPPRAAASSAMY